MLLRKVWVFVSTTIVLFASTVMAAEIEFRAEVDKTSMSAQDLLTLRIVLQSSGANISGNPQFNAPDFQVINSYNSYSQNFQYDSNVGSVISQKQQVFTKVLHPIKTGNLKITGIQVKAGGQLYQAQDISIQVHADAQGGQSPTQNSPQNSLGSRLSQGHSSRRSHLDSEGETDRSEPVAFVKAVVSKSEAFKGEQLTVSYYLYHRARVFNIQVDKYPILNGFLREDLEMPMMGQRLDSQQVIENGVSYERALLARYAAFPLQEGELEIDSLSLKYNYYLEPGNSDFGDADPFFGFFQQMAPRVGSSVSPRVKIKVSSLPTEGKPDSFVGGVGDFNVTTAVDKYEVHENEAVTVTLKVEGKGNISSIVEPKKSWPDGIELYETQGRSQQDRTGRSGTGEKIFEFLLIPRISGKITLPALELGFFNPESKKYYTKSTDPIQLTVHPAKGGSSSGNRISVNQHSSQPASAKDPTDLSSSASENAAGPGLKDRVSRFNEQTRDLKFPENAGLSDSSESTRTAGSYIHWILYAVAGLFMILVGSDLWKKFKGKSVLGSFLKKNGLNASWNRWEEQCNALLKRLESSVSMQEIQKVCAELTEWVFNILDEVGVIGSRALTREELKRQLLEEKNAPKELWNQLESLLDYADTMRFAGNLQGHVESVEKGSAEANARSELIQKTHAVRTELRKMLTGVKQNNRKSDRN